MIRGASQVLCQYCEFRCYSNAVLLKHIKDFHQNDPNFVIYCSHCGKSYTRWNSLKKHLHRSHHDELLTTSGRDNVQPSNSQHEAYEDSCDEELPVKIDPQWDSAQFLLRATEEHSLTHDGIESLCNSVQSFVERVCNKVAEKVESSLCKVAIDPKLKEEVKEACNPGDLFKGLKSRYSREKYYEDHFNFMKPFPVCMGTEREWKVRKGELKIEEVQHCGYIIDFFSSIKALLSNPDVQKEVSQPYQSTDGILRDYCDGLFFKEHPVFRTHPNALHFILYYDDIEVANPLGSKAGFHKLGLFYYILGNIRPAFRSNLRAIQLLAVAKTCDIRTCTYGCQQLLQSFVSQVNLLGRDEGCQLKIGADVLTLHGGVIALLGDTPGSNFVGGFKEGVGFALRKCRQCLATGLDIGEKFHADSFIVRHQETHQQYLRLIEMDHAHSTTYGINRASPLMELKGFDITKCLPYDIMHSIFEGVARLHLNCLLRYLIDSASCISISHLNTLIKIHPYGYSEVDTKPVVIERESATSDFRFTQSASQMMTLIKVFPLMVGKFVEEDDEHWNTFLLLWDICSIALKFEVTPSDTVKLAWMVETYLEAFVSLYGATQLTPKMHHLVHLPQQILRFGPLRHQWCMRYESKNAQMKRFVVARSYKNVPLSVAIHHQLWMCHQLATRPGQTYSNYLYGGDTVASGTLCDLTQHKDALAHLCGDVDDPVVVLRANQVTILGTRYAKGCIIRVKDEGGQEDDPFLYTCIEDIYIHKDNKVFLLRVLTVLNHSEHFRSIRVGYSDQVFFCLYDTFFAHDILHTKEIDGQLFIVDFIHHF